MTDNKDLIDLNSEAMIFYHVALLRGFRAAATHLGLSKSVVSTKVLTFEKRIGRKLLFRSTRDVRLTPEGEQLFESCKNLFHASQALSLSKDQFQSGLNGLITISAPHDFMVTKLVSSLRELSTVHPKLRINLLSTDSILNLEQSKVDLAIRVGAEGAGHLYKNPFFEVEFGFYCRTNATKKRTAKETLEWVLEEGVQLFRPSRERSFSLDGKQYDVRVKSQFQVNDVLSLKSLILHSDAIGVLPSFAVEEEVRSGQLVRILPEAVFKSVKYVFLSGSRRQDDPRLNTIIEHLQKMFKE